MITWDLFPLMSLVSVILWLSGAVMALVPKHSWGRIDVWLMVSGTMVYACFVAGLWLSLGRPPLRTLGETRLWYSLFMMLSGVAVYARWHYRWLPLFSLVVVMVFTAINILCPDIHDRTLMPALQSAWFVPHVTVYMFSYSLFGCAFLLAIAGLWRRTSAFLPATDRLVAIGIAFLTFGMVSGCLWAKQAWGAYWSWDPKETWAAATWCTYLCYLHFRMCSGRKSAVWGYLLLIVGFVLLQMCWYGVDFLPSAADSMHVYR